MNIAFDFDGTIVNTPQLVVDVVGKYLNMQYDVADIKNYKLHKCFPLTKNEEQCLINEILTYENTCKLTPYPDAISMLNTLYEKCDKPIQIITIRTDTALDGISTFFDKFTNIDIMIYSTKDKGSLCKQLNITHFIDDHPVHVADVLNNGVQCLIYDQPYNQLPPHSRLAQLAHRVYSWAHIRDLCFKGFKGDM
jgi:uncharacterized HAD superfamily protein